MPETNWLPALLALAVGVIGGIVFILRSRSRPAIGSSTDGTALRRELEAKIETLRLLADDDSYAAQARRREIEVEAARLLREIEEAPATSSVAVPAVDAGRPLRVLLWVTGISAAAAVIYVLLLGSVQSRQAGAPVTGDQSLVALPASSEENALLQRIVSNPEDIDARLALARLMLDQGRMMEVHEQVRGILERDSDNALAMSFEAMVLLSINRTGEAETLLRRALTIDPELVEGWLHLGLVHFRQGDLDAALSDLEKAKAISPAQGPMIDALAAEMRRAAMSTPAETATGAVYSGTVTMSAEAAERYRGAVLFVIVRPAGTEGGPPAAVARMQVTGTEILFRIEASDSMTGAPLPQDARIEARIDADGNAMTRGGEPAGTAGASAGATDVRIVLE